MIKRVIFLILMLTAISALILNRCENRNHYERAKGDTLNFLAENEADLKGVFEECQDSGEYKGYPFYRETGPTEYVQLDFDAKGMLGGQYWGIIYCPNNDLIDGESGIEIYDENKLGSGNNIFIKEKLKDNWYFYYNDFDGLLDVTKLPAD